MLADLADGRVFASQGDSGCLVWTLPEPSDRKDGTAEFDAVGIYLGNIVAGNTTYYVCLPCAIIEKVFNVQFCVGETCG